MCIKQKAQKAEEPAAAPAPPLPAPDAPEVGQSRRQETRDNFGGEDAPNYRVNRKGKKPTVTPTGTIQM